MLFSDTLKVKALGINDLINQNIYYNKSSIDYTEYTIRLMNYGYNEHYGGQIINQGGTGNTFRLYYYADGHYGAHLKIPYIFQFGDANQSGWNWLFNRSDWDENAYYMLTANYNDMIYTWSDSSTTRAVTFQNVRFIDNNGRIFGSSTDLNGVYTFQRGRDMLGTIPTTSAPLVVSGFIEFDFFLPDDTAYDLSTLSFSFHPSYNYNVYSLKDDYKYEIGSINVTDSVTQQQLQDLNTSTDAIEDSTTNPNGGGILGTIKNFFGGFFDWLKDLLLGLFIPDDDYFSTWFTNLNTLLAAKLGMLYAPFDLLITVLNAVYSSSTDFTGVPFPEIRWGDTVIIGSQNLTFSSLLGEHFSTIQGYVYFATDVVLLFAFLMLLQRKISLVLRGHESG